MKVTIWKLGNLEHKILPTDKAVKKLARILKSFDKLEDGDEGHVIWGPDLEVTQIETSSCKFVEKEDVKKKRENYTGPEYIFPIKEEVI